MNAKRCIRTAVGATLLFSMSGCASVMSGRHADVTFYSNVPNAHVAIRDKHGKQVAVTETGSTVALKRKDKWVFPAKYTATFDAPGFQPAEVPIDPKVNPWVFGNIAFLQVGLVGLAVDNVTGAAWMPDESTYYQELTPLYGPSLNGATAQNGQPLPAGQPIVPQAQIAAVPPLQNATPLAPVVTAPASAEPIVQTAATTNAIPAATTYR